MSLLTYNGISLPYSQTTSFRNEAVADDFYGTDHVLTKYDITVQCLITTDAIDMVAPDLEFSVTDPATIMFSVKKKLLQRRKNLSFIFNGVEFIPQPPLGTPGTVDAMNGPVPQTFTYVRLNNTAWLCQYHIVAHYRLNPQVVVTGGGSTTLVQNKNLPANVVLYNRWEERVDLDASQYSKRVRSGRYMIRSDNAAGALADDVRSKMAVVGVPIGFVRESSNYTVSPDGLSVSYSLIDREVYRMPHSPAFEAQGEYTEQATFADGKRYGHVHVRMRAGKNVEQIALARTCVAVASSKLDIAGAKWFDPNPDNRGILQSATLTLGLYDNTAEARMSVFYRFKKGKFQGVAFLRPGSIAVPGTNGLSPTPEYTSRGSASLLLQAARYYDPDLAGADSGLVSDGLLEDTTDNELVPIGGHNQMPKGLRPGEAAKTQEA